MIFLSNLSPSWESLVGMRLQSDPMALSYIREFYIHLRSCDSIRRQRPLWRSQVTVPFPLEQPVTFFQSVSQKDESFVKEKLFLLCLFKKKRAE